MGSGRIEARGAPAGAAMAGSERPRALGAPDLYFSADVETDGPIPGEYSMLSFAFVYAGRFDGARFEAPKRYDLAFEAELRPISENYQQEALAVNGLDRVDLAAHGQAPAVAMAAAARWVEQHSAGGTPILVAYPLSFDWTWLYWYFMRFLGKSPFNHSRCFDLKTAIAVRGHRSYPALDRAGLRDELRGASGSSRACVRTQRPSDASRGPT